MLAAGKKAVLPGLSAPDSQSQTVIFQFIDLPDFQIRKAASQEPKHTFVGKTAALDIQKCPNPLRQRVGKYRTAAVQKAGNTGLLKSPHGLPSIGFQVTGDHRNIPETVSFLPHKAADPPAYLLHFRRRTVTGESLYMLRLVCICFPFKTKQLFVQEAEIISVTVSVLL